MRKFIEPALGMMAVLMAPVLGVLGFHVLKNQNHLMMCNCGCCQQLNAYVERESLS